MDDTPDTDLFSENTEAVGVGKRLGEDEVEVCGTGPAKSSSAGITAGCAMSEGCRSCSCSSITRSWYIVGSAVQRGLRRAMNAVAGAREPKQRNLRRL